MIRSCQHPNIVAYFGSYSWSVPPPPSPPPAPQPPQKQNKALWTPSIKPFLPVQVQQAVDLHGAVQWGLPAGHLQWYERTRKYMRAGGDGTAP